MQETNDMEIKTQTRANPSQPLANPGPCWTSAWELGFASEGRGPSSRKEEAPLGHSLVERERRRIIGGLQIQTQKLPKQVPAEFSVKPPCSVYGEFRGGGGGVGSASLLTILKKNTAQWESAGRWHGHPQSVGLGSCCR